jgi:sodium-dependent phosphate cotransporter
MARYFGRMALYAYLFFLSITMLGSGMKSAFKGPVDAFLNEHGSSFTELVSFVVGVLGTSLVQSSSTVTSMAVVLAQEDILPLIIAIGIVHGANLGTSVTSSLVAFASEIKPLTGRPFHDLKALLFEPRLPGFHRAVSTAVVHGLFNALMVTGILLALEIPFGLVHRMAEASAHSVARLAQSGDWLLQVLHWVSPKTYTKPVVHWITELGAMVGLGDLLVNVGLVVGSFALLFASLKGFSTTVKAWLLDGNDASEDDLDGLRAMGERLLGRTPADTFVRGLLLTIMVQSSSATTSMVVPLAALGLFSLRKVFPFIMGANIGTTTTALIAAAQSFGEPGFAEGMTIALCHFYLNCLAVVLVVVIPGLQTSVLGATQWLADQSERAPIALLGYLGALTIGMPAVVYFLPTVAAGVVLGAIVVVMLVGPHLYLRRVGERDAQPTPT